MLELGALFGKGLGDCLRDDVVDGGVNGELLLVVEGVEDFGDCLLALVFGLLACRLILDRRSVLGLLLGEICVNDLSADVHHLVRIHVTVHEDVVHAGTRVGAREHEAHFLDVTGVNELAALDEVLRPHRELVEGSLLDKIVRSDRRRVLGVEEHVTPHAIFLVLEDCVAQNLVNVGVVVLVDDRNCRAVLVLERVGHDRSPVRALQVRLRDVPGEIRFHFDPF